MKEKIKEKISIVMDIILVVLVIVMFVKYNTTKDKGQYNFCVEWNEGIYREDLLWKCWDIETGNKICGIVINQADNILYVYNHLNTSDYISYPCTKYAKTIGVVLPEPDLIDIEMEDIV
jgi:hypothetical protein